jgi:hypothetical protein
MSAFRPERKLLATGIACHVAEAGGPDASVSRRVAPYHGASPRAVWPSVEPGEAAARHHPSPALDFPREPRTDGRGVTLGRRGNGLAQTILRNGRVQGPERRLIQAHSGVRRRISGPDQAANSKPGTPLTATTGTSGQVEMPACCELAELNQVGLRLYEHLRPEVRPNARGWGANAWLNPGKIRSAGDLPG